MILKIFPGLEMFQWYRRSMVLSDLIAGLTVAIMLVPQGMAYAMLAGLPPVYGLYASTIPLIIYPLFGSSRQLAVGPVAIISLLVLVNCSRIAPPGSDEFIQCAIVLAFLVGLIQFVLGMFKAGFIANFFSHAVVSGFTSAAAIIILTSQLKHVFGIEVEGEKFLDLAGSIVMNLSGSNIPTLILASACIVILFFFKKNFPRFPAALLVVLAGTLAVYFFKLSYDHGINIVRNVPAGLPVFKAPPIDTSQLSLLVKTALMIIFVGYMESIAIARYISDRENYKIDPDSELKGLGLANLAGSFFSAYPVTGGLSRSAVNYEAGAKSGLSSIITAFIVILTLQFLTPLFYYLPKAVLASIIIVAVVSLVDIRSTVRLFKIKTADGFTLVVTFLATLILGVDLGLLTGIAFSLVLFIWRSAHPHMAEVGFVADKRIFRNISRYPEAVTFPEAVILRIDASIYFANMGFIEDKFRDAVRDKPKLKWIIVDLTAVNDIDAESINKMDDIIETYLEKDLHFAFAGMKGPVRDLVSKAGWDMRDGIHIEFLTVRQAIHELGLLPYDTQVTSEDDD